jgi:hypothetical protein
VLSSLSQQIRRQVSAMQGVRQGGRNSRIRRNRLPSVWRIQGVSAVRRVRPQTVALHCGCASPAGHRFAPAIGVGLIAAGSPSRAGLPAPSVRRRGATCVRRAPPPLVEGPGADEAKVASRLNDIRPRRHPRHLSRSSLRRSTWPAVSSPLLLQGLLTQDPFLRWGVDGVHEWPKGRIPQARESTAGRLR